MNTEDDYYQKDSGSTDHTESSETSDDNMAETALVPASLFADDCKPGDKYTVEVVSKHDSEVEIKHVRKKKDEKKNDRDDRDDKDNDEAHASIEAGIAKMGMM